MRPDKKFAMFRVDDIVRITYPESPAKARGLCSSSSSDSYIGIASNWKRFAYEEVWASSSATVKAYGEDGARV